METLHIGNDSLYNILSLWYNWFKEMYSIVTS